MCGSYSFRKATLDDVAAIESLIAASARGLAVGQYSIEQIEAALSDAFSVDTELITDQTYLVVEAAGELIACGGWSKRGTLFGGDGSPGRESKLLNPETEAARIRTFFVHPDWARRGIGRSLLHKCEEEARANGFRTTQLVATLSGLRLYEACGYVETDRLHHTLKNGVEIEFVPMRKEL